MSRPPKPLIERKRLMPARVYPPYVGAPPRRRARGRRTGTVPGTVPARKSHGFVPILRRRPGRHAARPIVDGVTRRPRKELPDGLAHVTCRTVRRFPLFLNAHDALALLDFLDYASREVGRWNVLAYCLMPNHAHYVVDAEIEQLSLVMRYVNGSYAQRFNRVHGYRGHLFQGRFHAKPIREEAHLPGALRYVIWNPVRAGLCHRPQDWRWSSYRACLGLEPARRFLDCDRAVALFGVDPAYARASLRSFVEHELPVDALRRGQSPGLSPDVTVDALRRGQSPGLSPGVSDAA